MISAIKLENPDGYKNSDSANAEYLEPISRVNMFVGSNNSGKSRFMRYLASQANYTIKPGQFKEADTKLQAALTRMRGSMESYRVDAFGSINLNEVRRHLEAIGQDISFSKNVYSNLRSVIDGWSQVHPNSAISGGSHPTPSERRMLGQALFDPANEIKAVLDGLPSFAQPARIYIPTLRGLRPLDDTFKDFYLESTRNSYFTFPKKSSEEDGVELAEPEIFTGLQFYRRLTDLLLGKNPERRQVARYQEFLSEMLYEGQTIELIPSQNERTVVVKIGKELERPIHELGDGIQSLVILTFLPFVSRVPSFFFIEEPEIYLHPGLQRKILEFFTSSKVHRFFLTTHSNHFLDLTADFKNVSIFTFSKEVEDIEDTTPQFQIEAVDSGHSSSLELLGVRNSSIFLVNSTIWVEGITDRLYFREMLSQYMDEQVESNAINYRFEEDIHYSFVEYGGANIVHWSFLDADQPQINVDRLCARAIVIIDKDGSSKLGRKDALQQKLQGRLLILDAREIENLLPPKIIKEVVLELEKEPKPTIRDFNYESYRDEYLGTFIESKILKGKATRRGGYKEEKGSGTLKGKLDFCKRALPKIVFDDLPESTKETVSKIFDFIAARNV